MPSHQREAGRDAHITEMLPLADPWLPREGATGGGLLLDPPLGSTTAGSTAEAVRPRTHRGQGGPPETPGAGAGTPAVTGPRGKGTAEARRPVERTGERKVMTGLAQHTGKGLEF